MKVRLAILGLVLAATVPLQAALVTHTLTFDEVGSPSVMGNFDYVSEFYNGGSTAEGDRPTSGGATERQIGDLTTGDAAFNYGISFNNLGGNSWEVFSAYHLNSGTPTAGGRSLGEFTQTLTGGVGSAKTITRADGFGGTISFWLGQAVGTALLGSGKQIADMTFELVNVFGAVVDSYNYTAVTSDQTGGGDALWNLVNISLNTGNGGNTNAITTIRMYSPNANTSAGGSGGITDSGQYLFDDFTFTLQEDDPNIEPPPSPTPTPVPTPGPTPAVVPEPSTVFGGLLIAAPIAARLLRRRRKS